MSTKQIEKTVKAVLVDNRCQYLSSTGRRCRSLAARDTSRASGLSNFCVSHSQLEQQYINTKSVTKELLGNMENLRTAVAVNDVLGRLFVLQAQNRIPVRNAMALAYTAQVILSSLETVCDEVVRVEGRGSHNQIIQTAIDAAYGPQKDDDDADDDEEQSSDQEQDQEREPNEQTPVETPLDAAVRILKGS
jgi:hypothetical protein